MGKDHLVIEAPVLPMSEMAQNSGNEIREIVETWDIPESTPDKKMILLSIGDPTTFGNLKTPNLFMVEIIKCVTDFKNHGYQHSAGMPKVREVLAERYSYDSTKLQPEDVMITSGCSGALDICIKALASPGDNILVPRPCFGLYKSIMRSCGVEFKEYDLIPDAQWQADIESMKQQITSRTRAILVNNPSNPCGSVFNKAHLLEILKIADECNLPILADEIYGDIVFKGHKFFPIASLTRTVPVLSVGGISKEYLVPGFRGMLKDVWKGATKISQLRVGGNSIVQAALPRILSAKPGSDDHAELERFHCDVVNKLQTSANIVSSSLRTVQGLTIVPPQGAMYLMMKIDTSEFKDIADDEEFAQKLVQEEHVFVLPGKAFGAKNFVRLVICPPEDVLIEACDRIKSFCQAHRIKA